MHGETILIGGCVLPMQLHAVPAETVARISDITHYANYLSPNNCTTFRTSKFRISRILCLVVKERWPLPSGNYEYTIETIVRS
jgi:hypothetical protein